KMNLVIHIGIAGTYTDDIKLTEVVEVTSEQWADLGSEDAEGKLIDGFELELMQQNRFPYKDGKLLNVQNNISTGLRKVTGLTVNTTSGTQSTIHKIKNKYSGDVE